MAEPSVPDYFSRYAREIISVKKQFVKNDSPVTRSAMRLVTVEVDKVVAGPGKTGVAGG